MHIHYTGIVEIDDGLTAILAGRADARSTEFGASCEFLQLMDVEIWLLYTLTLISRQSST